MVFPLVMLLIFSACQKEDVAPTGPIEEGSDPNFKIVLNDEGVLNSFNRKVEVFGVKIFAVPNVTDDKLLHAANLMAQFLDNDEDGTPDNQAVLDKMIENNAFMVMWKKESDLNIDQPNGWTGQDLGNDETNPSYISSGKTGRFDAALEEVFHIITHAGYSQVYPDVFGENIGSQLADAMDIARGGQFTSIPRNYPSGAWYTYDDSTCGYDCMATEYFYWAMTSILGAQESRLDEISQEWDLNTREKVDQTDAAVFQILTNPQYKLPTVLPDGTYRR